jgi:protein-S-isoprenylcysteine O-methyltransferase Ste14
MRVPAAPRIPPLAVWLLAAALMWLASWSAPDFGYTLSASSILAVCLALVGTGTCMLGVASFRRAATTLHPLRPATSSTLVVTGVYRLSRNPMYLGLLVVLLGWAVCLSNAVAFIWLPAFVLFMNRCQIAAEEAALEARFGASFAAYRSRVRRWL